MSHRNTDETVKPSRQILVARAHPHSPHPLTHILNSRTLRLALLLTLAGDIKEITDQHKIYMWHLNTRYHIQQTENGVSSVHLVQELAPHNMHSLALNTTRENRFAKHALTNRPVYYHEPTENPLLQPNITHHDDYHLKHRHYQTAKLTTFKPHLPQYHNCPQYTHSHR